jgi:ABC-type glutathione transport system ATPase component
VAEIIAPERPPAASAGTIAPLLAVRDLKKHFPIKSGLLGRTTSSVKAVDGISFDVMPGEVVGLIGPSGSGKSSLLHAAGLLERPTSGEIRIDGADVGQADTCGSQRLLDGQYGG